MTHDALHNWYEQHAADVIRAEAAIDIAQLHAWMRTWLPVEPALVLDVGAGSGRTAAWLAEMGHHVVAVESVRTLREHGAQMSHHQHIEWVNDDFPLERIYQRTTWVFDCIVIGMAWTRIAPHERERAFRKLTGVLKPGGTLVMSLPRDTVADAPTMYPVPLGELSELAQKQGMLIEVDDCVADPLGRPMSWQHVVVRIPDDGTGALPFLRHVILNDRKSSTYKLGLLRTMVRVADSAPGLAISADSTHVELPFGLIGLYWVRLYHPLTQAHLPQAPVNTTADARLGFAGVHYRQLRSTIASELAIGREFSGDMAVAVRGAIKEACDLIKKMPATYITYDDGRPVFDIDIRRALPVRHERIVLDEAFLWSFGSIRVPRHMWLSMVRFCAWIEPALIYEWQNLMHAYAYHQGRTLDHELVATAMRWYDPVRTVAPARVRAERLLATHTPLYCVWSGKRLDERMLDIDHVFPWAAKPCGDMWNLVPAARTVNQHEKRDRLISAGLLDRVADRLDTWWQSAYLGDENVLIARQFFAEAKTSLAVVEPTTPALLRGMHQLRLQLRKDQQIPEWLGPR